MVDSILVSVDFSNKNDTGVMVVGRKRMNQSVEIINAFQGDEARKAGNKEKEGGSKVSFQYDQYLARHRANVKRGFDWLSENLPGLMTNTLTAGWNTEFAHDQSKNEPDEYEAYDAYFYGNNRSYEVVQRYQRAWLLHIHRNPHHWQHWILIHDDMEDGELETVLEMPYDYIIEMICDWWSFSWQSGNLYEIFKWYEEHSKYIKLAQTTKITVEYILDNMKKKLQALQYADQSAIQPGA